MAPSAGSLPPAGRAVLRQTQHDGERKKGIDQVKSNSSHASSRVLSTSSQGSPRVPVKTQTRSKDSAAAAVPEEEANAQPEASEADDSSSATDAGDQVVRGCRGHPRPAKVAALVWRACGRLVSRVQIRQKEQSPEFFRWHSRLLRVTRDSLLVRLAKQVLEWERVGGDRLGWISGDPVLAAKDALAEDYMPGRWILPSEREISVADATGAMLTALSVGGVKGDYAVTSYVQHYLDGCHKRLAIKGYTAADKASLIRSRHNLQKEFRTVSSSNRRFQSETRILANELGRRRAENVRFDTFAHTISLKDKFFRVQLRQSQLTAEANLAARSLYTFRQLSKFYASFKEFMEAPIPKEKKKKVDEPQSAAAKAAAALRSSSVRSGSTESKDGKSGGRSITFDMSDKDKKDKASTMKKGRMSRKGARFSLQSRMSHSGSGAFGGYDDDEEGEDERRSSLLAEDDLEQLDRKDLDMNDDEGHQLRVEYLHIKREQLKMAATSASGSNASRFDQLIKLMDQGHDKMQHLYNSSKASRDVLSGLKEALEEEALPQARKWVLDCARTGKLPREVLDKVQTESFKKVGSSARDALMRKVQRMEEILEENQAESHVEKSLRAELEKIGGSVPLSPTQKAEAARSKAAGRRSRRHVDSHDDIRKVKHRLGLRQGKLQKLSEREGDETEEKEKKPVTSRLENVLKDSFGVKDELLAIWPAQASEEGILVMSQADVFYEASVDVCEALSVLRNPASVDWLEDTSGQWNMAGDLLCQHVDSLVDSLEYEPIPDSMLQAAIKDYKDGKREMPSRTFSSRRGSGLANKSKMQLLKLHDALSKLDKQITAQQTKCQKLSTSNEAISQTIAQTEQQILSLREARGEARGASKELFGDKDAAPGKHASSFQSADGLVAEDVQGFVPGARESGNDGGAGFGTNKQEMTAKAYAASGSRQLIDGEGPGQMEEGADTTKSADGKTGPSGVRSSRVGSQAGTAEVSKAVGEAKAELDQAFTKKTEMQAYIKSLEHKLAELEAGREVALDFIRVERAKLGLPELEASTPLAGILAEGPEGKSSQIVFKRARAAEGENSQRRGNFLRKGKSFHESEFGEGGLSRRTDRKATRTGQGLLDGGLSAQERAHREEMRREKQEQEDLEAKEPWRKAFPHDPPEVAKQKWEFCRAHKVVYAHLYIHKKQRRLKFKLLRTVKQQRRHLKLKTKLLMSFLTADQKMAFQAEFADLEPDGMAKKNAHHKAELSRMQDRFNMLSKLLAFWKRRMGQFEEEIETKRKAIRGEIWQALEHCTRMADLLRLEREVEKEHVKDRQNSHDRHPQKHQVDQAPQVDQPATHQADDSLARSAAVGHQHDHGKDHGSKGEHHARPPNSSDQFMHVVAFGDGLKAEVKSHGLASKPLSDGNHAAEGSGLTILGGIKGAGVGPEVASAAGPDRQESNRGKNALVAFAPPSSQPGKMMGESLIKLMHTRDGTAQPSKGKRKFPNDDEAHSLDFLQLLVGRLRAITHTCDLPSGSEAALSNTLLAANVDGESLLRHYLCQIFELPDRQQQVVIQQLIDLENKRLLVLVKAASRRTGRHTMEACQKIISLLSMDRGKLAVFAKGDQAKSVPQASDHESPRSSFGSSSSSGDQDPIKKSGRVQRKKRCSFDDKLGEREVSHQSIQSKASKESTAAQSLDSFLSEEGSQDTENETSAVSASRRRSFGNLRRGSSFKQDREPRKSQVSFGFGLEGHTLGAGDPVSETERASSKDDPLVGWSQGSRLVNRRMSPGTRSNVEVGEIGLTGLKISPGSNSDAFAHRKLARKSLSVKFGLEDSDAAHQSEEAEIPKQAEETESSKQALGADSGAPTSAWGRLRMQTFGADSDTTRLPRQSLSNVFVTGGDADRRRSWDGAKADANKRLSIDAIVAAQIEAKFLASKIKRNSVGGAAGVQAEALMLRGLVNQSAPIFQPEGPKAEVDVTHKQETAKEKLTGAARRISRIEKFVRRLSAGSETTTLAGDPGEAEATPTAKTESVICEETQAARPSLRLAEKVRKMVLHRAETNQSLAIGGIKSDSSDPELHESSQTKPATQTQQSEGPSMGASMMAARFARKLCVAKKSHAVKLGPSLREQMEESPYIEACAKLERTMKRKGNFKDTQASAQDLAKLRGHRRGASAMGKITARIVSYRDLRSNKEMAAAAFLGRKAFDRRHSACPPRTDEHDAEWMAIKEAVRQTKHMRFNERQKRVAEMLLEMNGTVTPDSNDSDNDPPNRSQDLYHRMMKFNNHSDEQKAQSSVLEQVRKEISTDMRRAIQRKTRTDNEPEDEDNALRRRARKKKALTESNELGFQPARSANWKLDEELFAMMEAESAEKSNMETEKEEEAASSDKSPRPKISPTTSAHPMSKIAAKDRKLRQRAMLGVETGPGKKDLSSQAHRNVVKNRENDERKPRWKRLVKTPETPNKKLSRQPSKQDEAAEDLNALGPVDSRLGKLKAGLRVQSKKDKKDEKQDHLANDAEEPQSPRRRLSKGSGSPQSPRRTSKGSGSPGSPQTTRRSSKKDQNSLVDHFDGVFNLRKSAESAARSDEVEHRTASERRDSMESSRAGSASQSRRSSIAASRAGAAETVGSALSVTGAAAASKLSKNDDASASDADQSESSKAPKSSASSRASDASSDESISSSKNASEDLYASNIEGEEANKPRRDRRAGFVMPSVSVEQIAHAEASMRPKLRAEGTLLEKRLGIPLSVIVNTVVVQDAECQEILLSLSSTDFVITMESMLQELEKRYITVLEQLGISKSASTARRRRGSTKEVLEELKERVSTQASIRFAGESEELKDRVSTSGSIRFAGVSEEASNAAEARMPSKAVETVNAMAAEEQAFLRKPENSADAALTARFKKFLVAGVSKAKPKRRKSIKTSASALKKATVDRKLESQGDSAERSIPQMHPYALAINQASDFQAVDKTGPTSAGADRPRRGREAVISTNTSTPNFRYTAMPADRREADLRQQMMKEVVQSSELGSQLEESRLKAQLDDRLISRATDGPLDTSLPMEQARGPSTIMELESLRGVLHERIQDAFYRHMELWKHWRHGGLQGLKDIGMINATGPSGSPDSDSDSDGSETWQTGSAIPLDNNIRARLGCAPIEPEADPVVANGAHANGKRTLPTLPDRPVVRQNVNDVLDMRPTRTGQLPALQATSASAAPQKRELMQSPPKKKNKMVNMDQYLENFDGGDLDELLDDFSRPGTRQANSSRGSPSRGDRYKQDRDFGVSGMDAKVSAWPEFHWPNSGGSPGTKPTVSRQSTRSPCSPRTVQSATSSAVSAIDGWKRALTSREGTHWRRQQPPATAPEGSSLNRLPQSARGDYGRAGQLHDLPEFGHGTKRIATATGATRGAPGEASDKRNLAALCSGLEKQAVAMASETPLKAFGNSSKGVPHLGSLSARGGQQLLVGKPGQASRKKH